MLKKFGFRLPLLPKKASQQLCRLAWWVERRRGVVVGGAGRLSSMARLHTPSTGNPGESPACMGLALLCCKEVHALEVVRIVQPRTSGSDRQKSPCDVLGCGVRKARSRMHWT